VVLSELFPTDQCRLARGAFLIYSMMCVVTFSIVRRALPEPKGRTLEDIEQLWLHRK
jgi:hypothetical protein